jgi:sugar phosphate isomerase/epimerase
MTQSRRHFLAQSALGVAALATRAPAQSAELSTKFFMNLSCGRIGVQATFPESVELAVKNGFEGVDPNPKYFSTLSDEELQKVLQDLKGKNLKFGAGGLPVDFRKDDAKFKEGLAQLPDVAKALQRAGVWRVSTYISSSSNELTYLQNFRSHATRLRSCCEVLKEHGQKLGLEYVGPMTSWRRGKHPFIHCMSEVNELIAAIGTGNVGIHLDSWHWHCAQEGEAELLSLKAEDVTGVDLNDAPAGLTVDKLIDSSRELPAATGVIPVKTFLDALRKIGYDGPVHAEPFNAALKAMPKEEACAATAAAMKKAFRL